MGQILLRNFGPAFYSYYGLWDIRQFQSADVSGMLDLHPQFRCIASHMFSADLPFDSVKWDVRAFAFLRNPYERALSLYFHNVRMNKESGATGYVQGIEDFFNKVLTEKIDLGFFDFQTRFLMPGENPEFRVRRILELVHSGRLLLAPLEMFTEACLLLEQVYPEDFRNAAYTKVHMKSPRGQEIPEGLEAQILENNQFDFELYESVSRIFLDQLREVFPNEDVLHDAKENFAGRVEYLRQREKMEQTRNKITRSFGNLLGRIIK